MFDFLPYILVRTIISGELYTLDISVFVHVCKRRVLPQRLKMPVLVRMSCYIGFVKICNLQQHSPF